MAEPVEIILAGTAIAAIYESLSAAGGGRCYAASFPHFSETMMKTMFSMALVFGVCGLADAADKADKVDPIGKWQCEYEVGGQKRMSTLSIKKDADKLVGTMSWPDQKETNLKDLKLQDNTLTFSVVRKFADAEANVEYKLTLEADAFKGRVLADFGGQKLEFDILGKREKKDK